MIILSILLTLFIWFILIVIGIGYLIYSIIGHWKLYYKASVPEICCIIPFYNKYCMLVKIAKLHWGYFALYMFNVLFNIIVYIINFVNVILLRPESYLVSIFGWIITIVTILIEVALAYNLGVKFKKDTTWVILTVFFGFITIPLLGLSKKNIYYYNVDAPKGGLYFTI